MKVRFGMLMTDAVGKAGGQFIQRTRFGNVLRNITVPVQRLASLQNPQRVVNSFVFSRWSSIAQSIRNNWVVIGSNLITKNAYGEPVPMSGRDAFTRCNSILYAFNGTFVNVSAFSYVTPAISIGYIEINEGSGEISIDVVNDASVFFWQIKAMPLKNASINLSVDKLKTFFRDYAIDDPTSLFNEYRNIFGNPIQGHFIMFAIRGVSESGLVSEWQMFKVQVV